MNKKEEAVEIAIAIQDMEHITYTEDSIIYDCTYKGYSDIVDFISERLVKKGYGNTKKEIRDFVRDIKQEFFFMKTTESKDAIYQFTDSQMNDFVKKFLAKV